MKNQKGFTILRIAFGFVWAIDAYFKWQPAFQHGLVGMLTSMLSGQPLWVQSWITLWIHIVSINPSLFAMLIAIIETIIALGLIFNMCTKYMLIVSIAFSVLIWSIAEGFGGPYIAGCTDIGCAVIYAFVAVALLLGQSWKRSFFLLESSNNNLK
jgi:thiosulfate dehydrogenase [quinone] large subunit